MKTLRSIVLALSAFATVGVSAEAVYSGQADQERRERNREEALAHYRTGATTTPATSKAREETHKAANATRHGTHEVAESTRHATHKGADAARSAGHKTAVEARETTAQVEAKLGPTVPAKNSGEAQNPTGRNTTAPNGPK